MRLTRSVSYGIGVLLQIQQQADGGPMTAADISRGCRFPPRFLYRILHKLVGAGLLNGTSGPGGGYSLTKPAEEISLLDIASSVESAPEPSALEPACTRHRQAISRVNRICEDSAKDFAKELSHVSLADLDRPDGRRRGTRRNVAR
jgi:Rrf2 family transcriptional regulator, iron-sulfur cluster assembly transcription factor